MSTTITEIPIPSVTPSERAEKLTAAGALWTEHIDADVKNARLSITTTGAAEGSVASRIRAGKHEFVIDEPAGLAGADAGASPVEHALGALIACHVVVYRLYAQGLGIQVDDITAEADGDLDVRGLFGLDESVRPGFESIRINVTVSGPESPERYAELHAAVEAHCPVLDLFANPTPVTSSLTVR